MVQRTVSVGLVANVNNYVAGMEKARLATQKTAAAAVGSEKQLRAQGEAFTKLGVLAAGAGAVAAAGLALVVKASAEFGSKMAQLQSLSHASAGDMKALADAAMSAGTAYGFSASQVADAEIEMTKAGVSVSAQLGGALKGALALAAAGQLDVGTATEYATVAMTQFGLKASDIPHLADLMSAGADKALGSVGDLGQALENGGLQAHNMGLNIDQTVGLLSAFANSGIIGAEAGTQMRSMFIQLQKPTAQARDVLNHYGIALNDSKGKFVGITALAGELATKLSSKNGVDQAARNAALATIFGSHAITGATVLYQDGAKGIQGWIDKVNETGFANAQAAGKLNSLTGDVQKLAAAFQTDLIKAGTDASGSLRGVVQSATGLLGFLGDLPAPIRNAGTSTLELVAGVGLLGGAFLIAVPKVLAFKSAMADAGVTGRGLVGTFGKGGALVAGLLAVGGALSAMGQHGTANTQQLEQAGVSINNGWKGIDKTFEHVHNGIQDVHGLKAALGTLGDGASEASMAKVIDGLTAIGGLNPFPTHLADTYKANEQSLDAMGQQLAGLASRSYPQAAASFAGLISKYKLGTAETKTMLASMPAYREALIALAGKAHVAATEQNLVNAAQGKGAVGAKIAAEAAREAASAADKQSTELGKLTGSGDAATQSVKELHDALAGLGSTELDARSAARAFQKAIDDATDAARKNGRTLDINTQAGRDNQAALDAVASSARDSAAAYVQNGGSAKGAAKIIAAGRSSFIKSAEAMGASKAEANRLADALHLIPKVVQTAIDIQNAAAAAAKIADIKSKMGNLDGTTADIYVNAVASGIDTHTASQIARNAALRRAAGGDIPGVDHGKDEVPVLARPGEHMLTVDDVKAMGGQSGVYAFRAALHMAAGGAVGDAHRGIDRYRREVAAAKTALSRASKAHKDAAQQRLTAAQDHLQTAETRLESLQHSREDFVSTQRRGPVDPLSYVDQLRSMSRDSNFSAGRRSSYYAAANKYEASLVKLTTKADAAAQKLTDLKSASDQMRTSIASSIAGGYQASGAGSVAQASGWITRNGIRMQNYTSGVTGSSLASYYSGGAASTAAFAGQLKALASRKVNPALIAEIAGYGVEQGSPIAAAILSASPSQLATINSGYAAIQSNANLAGTTVANDNYAALITSQEKTTAALQKQLASDAERLRKMIAAAFGLKGYASGTSSATPGIHLVGEHGPELLRFRGGEQVYTAGQTRAYIRGTRTAGSQQVIVKAPIVNFPDTITVADASGFTATMRVVARQEITADAMHDAVLTFGGAA